MGEKHTSNADIFITKFSSHVALSAAEMQTLEALTRDCMTFDENEDVIHEAEKNSSAYLLQSGWAIRYKIVPNGGRQIISFLLPGDIFGFQESLFDLSDDSVQALTPIRVHRTPADRIAEICEQSSNLSHALTWSRASEQAILTEQIVRLDQNSLQRRNGAFGGHRAGRRIDRGEQDCLFTGKFHLFSPSERKIENKNSNRRRSACGLWKTEAIRCGAGDRGYTGRAGKGGPFAPLSRRRGQSVPPVERDTRESCGKRARGLNNCAR